MLIGYARVSTADQDLTLQLDALAKAGCEKVFTDKASGAKIDRPGLVEALGFARAGDTLVIWKLDRLGRSIQGLIALAADLSERGIDFRSLTDGFDTSTASGRLPGEGADDRRAGGSTRERQHGGRAQAGDDARKDRHGPQVARCR